MTEKYPTECPMFTFFRRIFGRGSRGAEQKPFLSRNIQYVSVRLPCWKRYV